MWKMLVGFIVFAAIVVFVLMKTDADIDMGGEKHGVETSSETSHDTAAAPAAPASEAAPAASAAASEAASAASN
jgi:hypothetical protein